MKPRPLLLVAAPMILALRCGEDGPAHPDTDPPEDTQPQFCPVFTEPLVVLEFQHDLTDAPWVSAVAAARLGSDEAIRHWLEHQQAPQAGVGCFVPSGGEGAFRAECPGLGGQVQLTHQGGQAAAVDGELRLWNMWTIGLTGQVDAQSFEGRFDAFFNLDFGADFDEAQVSFSKDADSLDVQATLAYEGDLATVESEVELELDALDSPPPFAHRVTDRLELLEQPVPLLALSMTATSDGQSQPLLFEEFWGIKTPMSGQATVTLESGEVRGETSATWPADMDYTLENWPHTCDLCGEWAEQCALGTLDVPIRVQTNSVFSHLEQ